MGCAGSKPQKAGVVDPPNTEPVEERKLSQTGADTAEPEIDIADTGETGDP